MEQVTFIQDNGKITTYDQVPVHANTKLHIFDFDLSKYKQNRNKSRSDLMNASTSSMDDSSLKYSKQTGVKIERANDLLSTLNYINTQEFVHGSLDALEKDRNREVRMRISELVGTNDSYNYLSNL